MFLEKKSKKNAQVPQTKSMIKSIIQILLEKGWIRSQKMAFGVKDVHPVYGRC